MTWANRFRLLLGSIAVLAVVGALTVLFNQRQHEVTSTTASVAGARYPVGSDYAGTVTHVAVRPGQEVAAGAELLTVQSASLLHDLRQHLVNPSTLAYRVSPTGRITFTAPVAARVADLRTRTGAFVAAGGTLLNLDAVDSLYVQAKVSLTASDYGRLEKGAVVDVLLPNQREVQGRVSDIGVTTTSGRTQATLTVRGTGLQEGDQNGLIVPGTPVTATVHLRDDGPLAGVTEAAAGFLRHVGL